MKKWKKNPKHSVVILPGVGRVGNDQVLEGDEYGRYSPAFLVEVEAESPATTPSAELPPAAPIEPAKPALTPLPTPAAVAAAALSLRTDHARKEEIVMDKRQTLNEVLPNLSEKKGMPLLTEKEETEVVEADQLPEKRGPGRPKKNP